MVVNGRPMKRMKRRVTADLYDFLCFPSADDHPRRPFGAKVKSFLTEYALCPPPASLIPHLLTWQMSFRVGDLTEGLDSAPAVVSLDVVEEDVARSRSVYCDQCRVVGEFTRPESVGPIIIFLHGFSRVAGCEGGKSNFFFILSLSHLFFFNYFLKLLLHHVLFIFIFNDWQRRNIAFRSLMVN
uniref:Uncharacterized protein n=1 Tax=Rhizophora mucronata TaxID=61149 RepID=A0A2P2MM26_RHIMU